VSEQINFTLDGQEVTVPKGWTVMQAAKKYGVAIPHFCWHPGLPVAGVCRFCLVHVEGARKLEISCNLIAQNGMVVSTVKDEVKQAHKWALEFHLINHPLDCPICDQAGECGLQDYYMDVGLYQSQMTRPKVLKPKAVAIGSELVLDTERCILCSKCVRFEETVTKTGALGIFSRGDRSIIGTYRNEQITHQYQENLVDVCPVGAFTSRRFRFKQRVWFLKEKTSICPGCATGCSIQVHAKPEVRRYFRVKPEEDHQVNGYWMCDMGRQTIAHLNPEARLMQAASWDQAEEQWHFTGSAAAVRSLAEELSRTPAQEISLLISAQYTNEEYAEIFNYFVGERGIRQVYQWREPTEQIAEFDGILLRGDRNANTQGLLKQLGAHGFSTKIENQFAQCIAAKSSMVIALSPEIPFTFPSLSTQLAALSTLPRVSLWTTQFSATQHPGLWQLLPVLGFAEKTGSFTNYEGKIRPLTQAYPAVATEVQSLGQIIAALRQDQDLRASLAAAPRETSLVH
jgi:NADH-quinone oxidoreductase subunit G